ncbi:Hypothetical predicted protein [Olea europaea subsp. europaea]|uniref:Uncharacterized protein n=1 Tax=Olea europaea subsp. europaea TaxID=158383 RepID=A0A8S0V7W0_OLEEU|nr:Hypothetical predicted protein [Olea europaea subsp. europaea]
MDFEYLVPKNARLRAHISQRSNLRYVKTDLEHFDDRQRTDFHLGIRGNARNWGSVCSAIGSSIPMTSELDVYQTAAATDLHVSAMLRLTEAKLGQPYISTLLPFEDRTVPALDDVARDIIPSQLYPEPLASGGNVGNSRGECALVSSGGGFEDDEESGDSDDEEAGEETGGDKSGDGNGEASDKGDSGDMHGRGFSPLPIDHDEDMDKEMQERNGGAGMESEPAMIGDDDKVASDGGCGMDSEPEKNSDDDEVPSGGSENRQDKPIASASGVAEVDGK